MSNDQPRPQDNDDRVHRTDKDKEESLEEALDESFPASDPPPTTPPKSEKED